MILPQHDKLMKYPMAVLPELPWEHSNSNLSFASISGVIYQVQEGMNFPYENHHETTEGQEGCK